MLRCRYLWDKWLLWCHYCCDNW